MFYLNVYFNIQYNPSKDFAKEKVKTIVLADE